MKQIAKENFTAADLHDLSKISDLDVLKERALALISNPNSTRPMKPEKVEWFTVHIKTKTSTSAVIKLMWDLLLAGDGYAVVGSGATTNNNSYRKKFN